jgi:hypothetical protein
MLTCCAFASAASTEAVALDGQPFQTDLTRIAAVRLHLKDGSFRIVGGNSDEISIRTDGKNAALAKNMKVQIRRTGDSLDLTLLNVPKNEVQITIAIPRETSLYARMRAGELSVEGVAGDKDLGRSVDPGARPCGLRSCGSIGEAGRLERKPVW